MRPLPSCCFPGTGKESDVSAIAQYGFQAFGERVSYAELIGQLAALAVVFLAQRRMMLTWPVQILACVLLFSVYLSADLGGLAIRQVIVFVIAVYGLIAWLRRRDPVHGVVVRVATWKQRGLLAALLVLGTIGTALLLDALDASWAPWPDAAILVGTAVAYLAQGLRMIEFWLLWLLVDAIGVPLQLATGLYFSAIVYIAFAALVIYGWLTWVRSRRQVLAAREAVAV